MAITRTSLTQPAYLERIKAAVVRAVHKAHKPTTRHGVGQVDVYNRRERLSLIVVAHKGKGFEVFDQLDNDVTDVIKSALHAYHNPRGTL